MRGLNALVGILSVSIDYDHPRSREILLDLHAGISSMAHYALSHAASNTTFRKSQEEMRQIYNDRGLDGKHLLQYDKKETGTVLYLAILQTIQGERDRGRFDGDSGCLVKSFDSYQFNAFRRDLELFFGSTLSVISCMSSNKLPFAYHQLLHWAGRVFLFTFTVGSYAHEAKLALHRGETLDPTTCYSIIGTAPSCATKGIVLFNVVQILTAYFILACLELYPTLTKVWQHSLVVKNYHNVVDVICKPLLPCEYDGQDDDLRRGRQKSLSELRLKDKLV